MALLRYEPWNTVERWHRQIEQALGDSLGTRGANGKDTVAWIPSVDVHEESDKFLLQVDLPGVESKDISLTAEQGVLTLQGQRRSEQREQNKGFARLERVEGSFLRRFTLPENVQADQIRARHNNGVLEVTIPKVPVPEPTRINVETH